jgi:hypothetical protein
MTIRVYFHQQAPGPESDPGKVVPVSRTVPRSPKVATAALNELLGGPTARERAAGYWSFFSDDTAGMLRSVRVTAGTGFADFRDFRRLVPDATSYGSAALLAESDGTLRQFRTIKCTLYAFNGDVPAFYAWLRLGPPWMPAGTWRAIAPAPSPAVTARLPSGRAASCWSGAGTAASPGAASARCVTAPPTTPPATAGSPSRPRRGRAGDVGRGRVDRITDAGLARQRPRRPDRRGHLRPRQAGMAPHRPEPDRVAGVLQHGLDRARADHVQREQRGRARGTRWGGL